MENRHRISAASLLFAFISVMPHTVCAPQERSGAIRTERTAPVYLPVWKKIEGIALARARRGYVLHPALYNLWQWAQESGKSINVVIQDKDPEHPKYAGTFEIEGQTPEGTPSVVIHLFLSVIDRTEVPREGGRNFVRFKELSRNERYAEVAGHELAHAFSILSDGRLGSVYQEFQELRQKQVVAYPFDAETLHNFVRMQTLSAEIERPAETAEIEIWRELLRGTPGPASNDLSPFRSRSRCLLRPASRSDSAGSAPQ
jgi:hypothetical protein